MDINRIITIVRNLKEDVPTNNTGSNGSTAGFSAAATGAVTGYDKLLHETRAKYIKFNQTLKDKDDISNLKQHTINIKYD